jgi:hypothetical protein
MWADITMGMEDVKQPEWSWDIRSSLIPPDLVPALPVDPFRGYVLPGLAIEVAAYSPPIIEFDTVGYFAAGTGTRTWIGVKIFIDESGAGQHRWYCAQMDRDFDVVNNRFLDSGTVQPGSFASENELVSTPIPGQKFQIDVARLIHPIPLPPTQPAYFFVDLEDFRILVLRFLEE